MIDPRLELVLLLSDKIFTIIQHMREVSAMEEAQALQEVAKERAEKDNLVEEVTL